MLKLARTHTGKRVFVALMAAMMLFVVVAPGRTSIASVQTRLLEQKLLQRWTAEDNAALVSALHVALASQPESVDQFVDEFLGQLDDADGATARAVLSQLLPGLAVSPGLSGGWLVDLRRIAQADVIQSTRASSEVLAHAVDARISHSTVNAFSASARSLLGSNLTRAQIRYVISVLPLGP